MVGIRRAVDLPFLLPVGVLLVVGIGMVFSASFVVAHNEFGNDTYFLVRHLFWVGLGLVALLVTARMDYHLWQRIATPLYAVSLVLLTVVLIPGLGFASYGAARWLSLGPLPTIQPSELAKLAVVVYLASWITRVGGGIDKFTFGTIPFGIILSLSAGLVLVEPDLGTAIVLVLTAASVFFLAGANVLHALLGASLGCAFLLNLVLRPGGFRADRIQAFLDPWADPSGVGWHTTQALVALGSGGLSGLGLGVGRQKFYYLPNAHTDSIFAVVGEEIGFIGTLLVLGMFLFLAWRGLTIAAAAHDSLGRNVAGGATLLIAWQGLLNMAVVSHVVPNTGVPLPFVSYGGNSMLVSLIAVGMVLSVARTVPPERLSLRGLFASGPPEPVAPEVGSWSTRAPAKNGATSARRPAAPRPSVAGMAPTVGLGTRAGAMPVAHTTALAVQAGRHNGARRPQRRARVPAGPR